MRKCSGSIADLSSTHERRAGITGSIEKMEALQKQIEKYGCRQPGLVV